MKLSSILFRDRNRSQAATNNTDNPSAVGFCPPKRDRSKSLCVPHAMPLIRVETCREDGSAAVAGNVQDLLQRATETHREYIVGTDQYVDVCSLEGEWRETKRRERERDMAKGRGEVYDWGVARWKQPE
ncbi:hypothetical protein OUZ56_015757 [Daphnia magna]|uniref:Uncharacterized protein n=1 Tax=Daphnia magna TaxID=35525 RepID=A0ABR0ANN3_9CRUS|nr:hypothetical protein OUZ56_015757 [Daphnia magna]